MTDVQPFALDLTGLATAPAQTWGAVRLVPLLRDEPIEDLRLHPRLHGPDEAAVLHRRTSCAAFVPHAFVTDRSSDGAPEAAYGTQLIAPGDTWAAAGIRLRFRGRRASRERVHRLRFLPLQLAVEGYLALDLGWTAHGWEQWTHQAVRRGLSPWVEAAYTGGPVPDLADALRIFEIHPRQCGVVLYTGDRLTAAFVVPHPADYRTTHPTLLLNLYGEQLHHYARMFPDVPDLIAPIDDTGVRTPADLRARLAEAVDAWRALHTVMADGLFGATLHSRPQGTSGRFTLHRFRPDYDPRAENHVGEAIVDDAGRLAYLTTVRLSEAQTRRAHLLSRWTVHGRDLDATAADLGVDRDALVQRLDRAGFGHLLPAHLLDAVRARHRSRS